MMMMMMMMSLKSASILVCTDKLPKGRGVCFFFNIKKKIICHCALYFELVSFGFNLAIFCATVTLTLVDIMTTVSTLDADYENAARAAY